MASLVGRECWVCSGGVLLHGKVVEQRFEPDACTILTAEGERRLVASANVKLSLADAIDEVEDMAWYWQRQLRKLEELRDAMEAA